MSKQHEPHDQNKKPHVGKYGLFWWGMTISEARLYDFRQVTPHPNAAYYSIFRVRQTVENKASDFVRHFSAELLEERIFLLFSNQPFGLFFILKLYAHPISDNERFVFTLYPPHRLLLTVPSRQPIVQDIPMRERQKERVSLAPPPTSIP